MNCDGTVKFMPLIRPYFPKGRVYLGLVCNAGRSFAKTFIMEPERNLVKPAVIVFDVYETLLDMSDVERRVNNLMDSIRGYRIWFELFMQYCFVDNCTTQFNDFSSIAKATMKMTGSLLGHSVSDDAANSVLELLKHVPVHEHVPENLSLLSDEGYRIAALTNSPQKTILERMEHSGLISYFEHVLSAEQVKKYKPCIEVYEMAAKKLEVSINEILLVSAHGWDITGGANAGMQTAFIKHPREMLYPLAPQPEFICKNLDDLTRQLGITVNQNL
jgi:2-haloacid dehalogenase